MTESSEETADVTEKGLNPRAISLEILLEQEKNGEKLNLLINDVLNKYAWLEKKDRAFIKILSEGSVERRITLDHVIDRFSSVKSSKMKPVIRNVLRMGAYQMLFMDSVPSHAVINESVKLVKLKHFGSLTGFVNGVLRSLDREGFDIEGIEDPAVRYSVPGWIHDKFREQFGEEKALEILRSSLEGKQVYIRSNIARINPDELKKKLEEKGVTVKETGIYPYAFSIGDFGDLSSLSEFSEGLFSVQDISSMSVGNEIAAVIKDKKPESFHILDVCAAPGGKSCHAAEILNEYLNSDSGLKKNDFSVVSRDISEKKLSLIEENRDRLGLDIMETVLFDAREEQESSMEYDLIIADLPCSGLGVMGRKNDLKYRVLPEDIASLQSLQRTMLLSADKSLKKGGTLIFSVCTIDREETFDQDSWILNTLKYIKLKDRLFLPDSSGSDGFYYGVYIKNG